LLIILLLQWASLSANGANAIVNFRNN